MSGRRFSESMSVSCVILGERASSSTVRKRDKLILETYQLVGNVDVPGISVIVWPIMPADIDVDHQALYPICTGTAEHVGQRSWYPACDSGGGKKTDVAFELEMCGAYGL